MTRMMSIRRVNNNILANLIRQTLEQRRHTIKRLIQIQTQYLVCRYIRRQLIKPSMYENIMIDHKTRMPEPFDIVQLVPV